MPVRYNLALCADGGSEITGIADGVTDPKLSVVIPAYNEERRLPQTLQRLRAYLQDQPYSWEILVVCNGCTDRTADMARAVGAEAPRVRVLELRERGKGLASKTGALTVCGEVVFLCDADLSMPPERLSDFLEGLERADVVVGSREATGSHRYEEPWHRHLMGRVFNRFVQIVAVPGIEDTQCGFKAFRRDAAQDLFGQQTLEGWGFDVELLFLARRYGYLIEELGIDWFFDSDTRVRPGIDTVQMLREVGAIRVRSLLRHYRPAGETLPDGGNSVHA